MRKVTVVCSVLLLTLAFGMKARAQESSNASQPKAQEAAPAPEHFYHLDFVVEELNAESKPVNSRTYSTSVNTGQHSNLSIRTGSRIPIPTGTDQYQYSDVGVDFDVHNVREVNRQLAFDLTVNVSGVAENPAGSTVRVPIIRQNRWQASVLVPVGKSTPIFASDSNDSKGSTRVLVTATPIE